jgi:hypothetical protein
MAPTCSPIFRRLGWLGLLICASPLFVRAERRENVAAMGSEDGPMWYVFQENDDVMMYGMKEDVNEKDELMEYKMEENDVKFLIEMHKNGLVYEIDEHDDMTLDGMINKVADNEQDVHGLPEVNKDAKLIYNV